ncbi:insulinase family protein [Azospirillum oryzae]|uniref:Insulinase family protein n=1 Tax=Azospirillum oryzae TaxID=286727 RepID=A0A6N1AQ29_9PROT|nr:MULTISPECIES: pitrilysin family protein [Azospirillum]KAA0580883.1 insulinase family protein [Azospirillum sp. Sh1]KAA0591260.1 insulinase family protein [Azospirillum oryzae]QKS52547.1 insulinase family protein [Azospirillum oryzae]GLR79738.1 peptidase M16 [Azospirillum oryzae]
MSSIRVTTLPNGLRVATDTMPDVQSVSLGCWVGVGTRNEAASVNGVAHLVEHMLFKGTRRRSAFRISEEIENVGGQLNAYTTREQTAYYAKVLHEDAPLALDILSDMIQHSTLDAEELVRERTVVLQEIGQSADTPDDIIFDHFQSTAYPGQAIGRPVLGSAEIVGALPREALVDYIGGHYGAPGMVLSAAGRIEHDRMVDLAFKAFGDLPSGAPPKPESASYTGGDFREDRDLEQMHLVLGFDGVGVHDPDFYAHSVLSTLLGGGMSSRLFQEVREKRGLVYSIYTFTGGYHDGGLFGVYAGTGEDEVAELVPVVCDEIAKVGADVTEDEVARARAQLKAGTLMALESTMSRCEQLGQQILIYDRPVPVEEIVAKIDGVDRDAVVKAASRLRASRPTVAALGPIAKLESYDRIAERLA